MSIVVAPLFVLMMMQASPPSMSRDQAIAMFEQQGRTREAHFSCVYDAAPVATRRFVAATDPYFALDTQNAAAAEFSRAVPSSVVFGSCVAAVANATRGQESGSVAFDFQVYRTWAARRVYLEHFPQTSPLDRLHRPKRAKANYGPNTKAVAGLLKTIDCAVLRQPAAADLLVRNGNPNQLHLDDESVRALNVISAAFNRCADRATPNNGPGELNDKLTGLLADSLLRMTGEAQEAASDA